MHLYPSTAACNASPIPVLPDAVDLPLSSVMAVKNSVIAGTRASSFDSSPKESLNLLGSMMTDFPLTSLPSRSA